ncbi:hypothetical protein SPI_00149 [Niveomyces insectorum RCEF 264]|uniref:GDS1 winged helix domain-containing protein n=1 Tax=Niveomyces insectorum RCEF 264 TaxID=1081102 RepID=A0A167ZVS4_9HYPO|nr:hypothetical protein SPI_00149 [Niveomyces insectorum RCEF 264]
MPYNTRRKSLSLPSLGIHVPVTHAARVAANRASPNHSSHHNHSNSNNSSRGASPAASATTTTPGAAAAAAAAAMQSTSHRRPLSPLSTETSASSRSPKRASSDDDDASAHPHQQPGKRMKRAHGAGSISSVSSPSSSLSSPRHSAHAKSRTPSGANTVVTTPPPSPKRQASVDMDASDGETPPASPSSSATEGAAADVGLIDMRAVDDDIVEGVILQLQATGNRPHLIKELSAVLMHRLKSVQQSANPCAIISSRLASYMKRPCWSAGAPCPLMKELENIHPRRTYYFLTVSPHLPLPDASSNQYVVPRTSIVTPPLSTAPSGSEAAEDERRRELSPSPEVDLSSPELDDAEDDVPMPNTPIGSFSARFPRASSHYVARDHRGASPPLEKDEKEFTQTAEGLQKRRLAGHASLVLASAAPPTTTVSSPLSTGSLTLLGHGMDLDEAARDDSLLFGSESRHLVVSNTHSFAVLASPAMRPTFSLGLKKETEFDGWAKLDTMLDWDRSPESIELEELDGLLGEF